ncbi:MAG: transcriptional regulator [Nitrososphaerales archaeon]
MGIVIYGWLLFFIAPQLVLQISAFVAIVAILGILAWIGWTMANTLPPAPIEAELTSTMAPITEIEEKPSS